MDLVLLLVVAAALAVGTAITVAVFRSRARGQQLRLEQERQIAGRLVELEQRAGSALVRADERVRLANDELGFAIAEFGDAAAAEFRAALERAKQRLSEAFQMNQRLSDHVPDTDEQRRDWNERIISLCQSAESSLKEQSEAFAARRAAAHRIPSELDRVRAEIARIRQSVPPARATLASLAERYSAGALDPVAANADQAEQLLEFAGRSAEVADARLAASRAPEASAALQAAAESTQRAEALLDAIDSFEVEAIKAEAALAAMIAESNAELAAARELPESTRRASIDAAIANLERALESLPAPGSLRDPIGALSAVRRANTALDDAVAEHTQRADRRERMRAQLVTAMDDAERQIAAARGLVLDYGAPVGPDARTRLAEAERELAELPTEREPEPAIRRARRAAALAAEAGAIARADLERMHAAQYEGYGAPRGYGSTGSGVIGGVLGGLAIGGLLDGLGDLGDFGDFFG
jgi:chromosome segregation ATPase